MFVLSHVTRAWCRVSIRFSLVSAAINIADEWNFDRCWSDYDRFVSAVVRDAGEWKSNWFWLKSDWNLDGIQSNSESDPNLVGLRPPMPRLLAVEIRPQSSWNSTAIPSRVIGGSPTMTQTNSFVHCIIVIDGAKTQIAAHTVAHEVDTQEIIF